MAAITSFFGVPPVYLLASQDWAFTAILVVIVWKYFGFHMMLYVAGLQGMDKSLLEAAAIDGASPWQRFWRITFPLLGPMIRLSIFFSVVGSLQLFDVIPALTAGGPFEHDQYDGVVPLLFRHHPHAGRLRLGGRRGAVRDLRSPSRSATSAG